MNKQDKDELLNQGLTQKESKRQIGPILKDPI